MAKNKWFGTDGIRGVANEFPITAEFVLKLGMAAAELVCTTHKKVAIAKDTRLSGDMLEAALIAGFTAKGVDVIRLGVVPTPAVTTFVADLNVDMAVMITASHNPYQDNGIKLIAASGDKFADETTAALETLIEQNKFEFDKNKIGKVLTDNTIKEKYKKIALDMFGQDVRLNGMKVAVDCANGCLSDILPDVLQKLGAEVIVLGATPDGCNINRDCGSQHVDAMLEVVKNQKADLGIAVDGDGDRIKICDNKGKLIRCEQVLAFLAQYLESTGENKKRVFASTKLSNTALERFITERLGLEYYSTNVGERPVIKALKEHGGVIGGEESGHIVLLDYAKSGDAMMTALMLIKGIKAQGKKTDEIFPIFEEDYLFFENPRTANTAQVKEIATHPELMEIYNDACQKMAGSGRVVIHPSGTEPRIRVWLCGNKPDIVDEYGRKLVSKIESLCAKV